MKAPAMMCVHVSTCSTGSMMPDCMCGEFACGFLFYLWVRVLFAGIYWKRIDIQISLFTSFYFVMSIQHSLGCRYTYVYSWVQVPNPTVTLQATPPTAPSSSPVSLLLIQYLALGPVLFRMLFLLLRKLHWALLCTLVEIHLNISGNSLSGFYRL